MKRRRFLHRTALLGASGLISVGAHGWAWRSAAATDIETPRLIVIMLRGAADGLSAVVPYQEPEYYRLRPGIAIAKPGSNQGAIDLDGQFGLHPSLSVLMPQWEQQRLAFVHAVGAPVIERSHFQAQDNLETGTPGVTVTNSGWLNRLLSVLPGGTSTRAVNVGGTVPLIFKGEQPVASLAVQGINSRVLPIDREPIQLAFDRLYAGSDRLSVAYQEGRKAREILLRELAAESMAASRGAAAPEQFAASARYLARLMVGDAATQVAFMELGNWDTHVNERGILNRNFEGLGNGLAALAESLGPVYQHTAIVVISEFGRTVAENGNGGTDHGYGNSLWLLGGGIRGQQFYGQWPGLGASDRHQSRDLAVTTDFRDVLISLLQQQFNLNSTQLAQIFPDYALQSRFHFL